MTPSSLADDSLSVARCCHRTLYIQIYAWWSCVPVLCRSGLVGNFSKMFLGKINHLLQPIG